VYFLLIQTHKLCIIDDKHNEAVTHYHRLTDLPLMKKANLSSTDHSARRRGCTLVVNFSPPFSFISTVPTGTEAHIGETILHIPGRIADCLSI
jgi:hypothetical protein